MPPSANALEPAKAIANVTTDTNNGNFFIPLSCLIYFTDRVPGNRSYLVSSPLASMDWLCCAGALYMGFALYLLLSYEKSDRDQDV